MTFDVSNTSFFIAATILSGTKIDYNQTAINSKIVQWLSMIVKSVYDITNEECCSFGGEFKCEDNLTPNCIIIESWRVSDVANNDLIRTVRSCWSGEKRCGTEQQYKAWKCWLETTQHEGGWDGRDSKREMGLVSVRSVFCNEVKEGLVKWCYWIVIIVCLSDCLI